MTDKIELNENFAAAMGGSKKAEQCANAMQKMAAAIWAAGKRLDEDFPSMRDVSGDGHLKAATDMATAWYIAERDDERHLKTQDFMFELQRKQAQQNEKDGGDEK